jgi:D-3-phosphoglycerate dehydrogenase
MSEMPEFLISLFDETYNTYKVWLSDDKNEFITNIQSEIDAIAVMGGTIVSADLMKSMPNLKIVGCYGVGYDAIDVNFANENGIKVTNTPEVLNDEVADTAISLMLAVYKKIIDAEKFARNNSWINGEFPLARKFSGTKLGIVGMGRIGKAIAKRADSFGCEISYHSRNKKNVSYKYFENVNKLAEEVDTL